MDTPQTQAYPDSSRSHRVIRLPFVPDDYAAIVTDCTLFRAFLDEMILLHPELFPSDISRCGIVLRRWVNAPLASG